MRALLLAGSALLSMAALTVPKPASAATIFVSASPVAPTLIGAVTAGQTYTVSATGIADLCTTCNGGGPLSFTADGRPVGQVNAPFSALAPNGLDGDPNSGGAFGQGGMGKLLGSLLGTFTASPTGPNDFFTIGLGLTFTAAANGSLFGVVNDTNYSDNRAASGFSVTLSQTVPGVVAVPEPASLALFGIGLAGLGMIRRSRKAA